MINKYERIKRVRNLGLNTEENILLKPGESIDDKQSFFKNMTHCSLRTFKNEEINTPHYPYITINKLKKLIPDLQKRGYSCIIAKPINPKYCLFTGAVWKTKNKMSIEIADGPYTVRRVTHEGKIDRRYFKQINKDKILLTNDKNLNECIKKFINCKLINIIFEFSYYKKPVGCKNEHFICWEITQDGTRESKL